MIALLAKTALVEPFEYLRPWKLTSYFAGLFLLLAGAFLFKFEDWDVGISVVMSILCYIFSPISLKALAKGLKSSGLCKISYFTVSLILTWITVDASYWAYWSIVNTNSLYLRAFQWPLSLYLYISCAILWAVPGTFVEVKKTWALTFKKAAAKFRKKD